MVLHHLSDAIFESLLSEILRITKPGSLLFLVDHDLTPETSQNCNIEHILYYLTVDAFKRGDYYIENCMNYIENEIPKLQYRSFKSIEDKLKNQFEIIYIDVPKDSENNLIFQDWNITKKYCSIFRRKGELL
jgi:hypothetical protein